MAARVLTGEALAVPTNLCCDSCGKKFTSDDEVFQATVRFVLSGPAGLEQRHVVDEDGDLCHAPLLFHVECWEEVVEGLNDTIHDVPPIEDEEAVLACTFCESGVREWEHYVRAHIGELRVSPRSPDGEPIWRFVKSNGKDNGSLVCISCTSFVHDEVLEIWDDVSQEGECEDCARDRCWRTEACDCDCHSDD